MATADELRALAERVEKLDGPCRITLLEIADLWYRAQLPLPDGESINYDPALWLERYEWDPLSSLDAAMTLGEDFLLVAMSDIAADGLSGVCLCSDTSTTPPKDHWGIALNRGANETRQQVLARCYTAAALRAKAAHMETEHDE